MLIGTVIVVISFVAVFVAYRMIDAKMKFQKNGGSRHETESKANTKKDEPYQTSQDWISEEAERRKNKTPTSSRNYDNVEYVKGEIQDEPENKSATQNRTAYY